jgi:hypothetical protein
VSFEPPPCDELTTSWPSGSATRVRPPGSTHLVAVVDGERAQVGVPRAHPSSTSVGMVEHDDRLRDPPARVGDELLAQLLELGGRGIRPHDEPLPPEPSTGFTTSSSSRSSTSSSASGSSSRHVSTFFRIGSSAR